MGNVGKFFGSPVPGDALPDAETALSLESNHLHSRSILRRLFQTTRRKPRRPGTVEFVNEMPLKVSDSADELVQASATSSLEEIEEIRSRVSFATLNPSACENLPLVDFNDLEFLTLIGRGGGAANVFKVRWKRRQKIACLKLFQVESSFMDSNFEELKRELEVYAVAKHPHVLKLFGLTIRPSRGSASIGLLLEFCAHGDLKKFLTLNPWVSFFERVRILMEIADGMRFLHSLKILNRDLKPQNVVITDQRRAKLVDFGLSRQVERFSITKTFAIGTMCYMSPEITLKQSAKYGPATDVFSFGILCFVVLSGRFDPYGPLDDKNGTLAVRVAQDPRLRPVVRRMFRAVKYALPNRRAVAAMKDLLPRLWRADPADRPSFAEIFGFLAELVLKFCHLEQEIRSDQVSSERTLYVRTDEMQDEDAEDLLLEFLTLDSLRQLVSEWGNQRMENIERLEVLEADGSFLVIDGDPTREHGGCWLPIESMRVISSSAEADVELLADYFLSSLRPNALVVVTFLEDPDKPRVPFPVILRVMEQLPGHMILPEKRVILESLHTLSVGKLIRQWGDELNYRDAQPGWKVVYYAVHYLEDRMEDDKTKLRKKPVVRALAHYSLNRLHAESVIVAEWRLEKKSSSEPTWV